MKRHSRSNTVLPGSGQGKVGHTKHSPFFIMWELATLSCVFIIGFAFLGTPYIHVSEETHHAIEYAVEAAELILIAEVALLVLVARDKIKFVFKNWPTVLAVLPFGGGFRVIHAMKIGWHAFEKTRVGHFFKHPIRSSKRWVHLKLGLRV